MTSMIRWSHRCISGTDGKGATTVSDWGNSCLVLQTWPRQAPMIGELTGPRGEPTAIILLNGHETHSPEKFHYAMDGA